MSSKKKRLIYTDGSDVTWAYLIVENGEVIHKDSAVMPRHPELNDYTEAEAIFQAVKWAVQNPHHYLLITDSKSAIKKIKGDWQDHTRNPRWKGIQNMIEHINNSITQPISFSVEWKARLSDQYMKAVDAMCGAIRE